MKGGAAAQAALDGARRSFRVDPAEETVPAGARAPGRIGAVRQPRPTGARLAPDFDVA